MLNKGLNITIVGLGLLGGSYAMALTSLGYKVKAVEKDPESVKFALDNGYVLECSDNPTLVSDADLVVVALYPKVFVSWLKENQNLLKSGCILTDVTGVKKSVVNEIKTFLRSDVEFVPAHPMAGRETSGIKYANKEMFNQANYIVVPDVNNTEKAIETVKELGCTLGFKNITSLTAEEHDKMIGFLSQLTHVIAVTLMNTNDNTHLVDYTGDSFRDLTRIAKINPDMWYELFVLNKENLVSEIEDFEKELAHFKESLISENESEIKRLFKQSTERRKLFDKVKK